VAGTWRIRHKLIFGMTLVLAVMGLLLAGTYKGLASYRANMSRIDNKLVELEKADELRAAVKQLGLAGGPQRTQAADLQTKIKDAKDAFQHYFAHLQFTVERSAHLPKPREWEQAQALELQFTKLDESLIKALEGLPPFRPGEGTPDLLWNDLVRTAIDELVATSGDLIDAIHGELHSRTRISRSDSRTALVLVIGTSIGAVLLMGGLLRFFYRWVVHPIRDLEGGVSRVAKGDFDHRIEIHSGDEIEDLAKAFNDMSSRLSDKYRDLAQQVNERSRQLVRSERLAGVGFLAAGVAHEINNPLASIAFCSEALERRFGELFDSLKKASRDAITDDQERDIIHKYLKMIQEEAFRCKEITQKLLAFSRGGERKREATDLAELMQGVLDMVGHLQNCKGKDLVFRPTGRLTASVNGQEIKQVFLNLVVNALDSMDEGGRLTIAHRVRPGMVELVFQDTGCGMTAEVLENIFEPFYTKCRTGKGTGLGLSISHRIVTAHGGEIEAESPGLGQGSTFRIRLPLETPMALPEGNAVDLDPEVEFLKMTSARSDRKAA